LVNKIKPNIIPKYNLRTLPQMDRDNIKLYLTACEQLGVGKGDLFNLSDLYDKKNLIAVIQNLYALAKVVQSMPNYNGPVLEAKSTRPRSGSADSIPYKSPTTPAQSMRITQLTNKPTPVKTPARQPIPPQFTVSDPVAQYQMQEANKVIVNLYRELDEKEKEIQSLREKLEKYTSEESEKVKQKNLKEAKWNNFIWGCKLLGTGIIIGGSLVTSCYLYYNSFHGYQKNKYFCIRFNT